MQDPELDGWLRGLMEPLEMLSSVESRADFASSSDFTLILSLSCFVQVVSGPMLVHWPLETCFRLDTVTFGGFRRLGLQPKILEQWKHQQHGVVFESKAQALSLE